MPLYYVTKTEMEMFDVCRAYGLGILLDSLIPEGAGDVMVKDSGSHFVIESPVDPDHSSQGKSLLVDLKDESWSRVFLTNNDEAQRRGLIEELRSQVANRTSDLLGYFQLLNQWPFDIKPEKQEQKSLCAVCSREKIVYKISGKLYCNKHKPKLQTLPLSMDVAAAKGIRWLVRFKSDAGSSKYNEGENVKVHPFDWSTAALGQAHTALWKFFPKKMLTMVPKPGFEGVKIKNWRNIRTSFGQQSINFVGVTPALAHTAVLLARNIQQRKVSEDPFIDKFDAFVFASFFKTANQWKPSSAGLFPLEWLYQLAQHNPSVAGELLELWDKLFRNGNRQGLEDLALSLAEFIAAPSLDNFRRLTAVHLRHNLKNEISLLYNYEAIKEMISHVEC